MRVRLGRSRQCHPVRGAGKEARAGGTRRAAGLDPLTHPSPPIDDAVAKRLAGIPVVPLCGSPTPVQELTRLRQALGGRARLFVKRDDAIPLAFGGNKVRKLELVAAAALAADADTLVTCGGVQSNHVRATAATAARLGLDCHVVANGEKPARPAANALLVQLLGASVEYVGSRGERAPAMHAATERLRQAGRRPFMVPLGASTPLGALGFVRAIGELAGQMPPPNVIVHACSSGGTQAGLLAGCALYGWPTRTIGISADDPAGEIADGVRTIVEGVDQLLGACGQLAARVSRAVVDDGFVGPGYGEPTAASCEAQALAARAEALFVDHTYTAKALAGVIAYVRDGRIGPEETVLFWHTGGQVGLFT